MLSVVINHAGCEKLAAGMEEIVALGQQVIRGRPGRSSLPPRATTPPAGPPHESMRTECLS